MTERMKEGCWEKETQSGEEKWQRRETVQKSYWFLAFRGFWPLTFYLLSCTKLLFFLPLSFHFLLCFPLFILSLYIFISRHNVCFLFFFAHQLWISLSCSPWVFLIPLSLWGRRPMKAPGRRTTCCFTAGEELQGGETERRWWFLCWLCLHAKLVDGALAKDYGWRLGARRGGDKAMEKKRSMLRGIKNTCTKYIYLL